MALRQATFSLRAMEKPDAPAVAALIRTALAAQFVVTDPPPSALGVTENDVAAHLDAGGGAVAEAGGGMMGSTLWTEQDDGLYLARLAVAPSWRGRGVAKALMATAEATARRMALSRIHLSTRLVLLDNRRLFGVCGFIETTCHAHPGYREPTFVTMEKRLAPAAPPGLLPPGEREIW
jgi:predicted N-acetyltransferase YhbS